MSDVLEKLLGYLSHHSFIKEALIREGRIYFSTNIIFEDVQIFINRFDYLAISYKEELYCIENSDLDSHYSCSRVRKILSSVREHLK